MEKYFDITGMTCSACSAHVQKAVEKLNGVKKAPVNLLTGSMKAVYDEKAVSVGEIIAAVERAGYGAKVSGEKESGAAAAGKKDKEKTAYAVRLWVSIAFTLILMYFSMGGMIGLPQPFFLRGESGAVSMALTQMLLCLPVLYVNAVYFKNGFKRLFTLSPNMDSLIALGSSVSFLYGIFALFRMSYGMGTGNMDIVHTYMHELYFESAAMILTLITLGKFFEERSKRRTTGAVEKLKQLVPPTAVIIKDGAEISVDSASLKTGDIAVLKAGAKIPCDGEVTEGEIYADESAITGESMPVLKTAGALVTGGTVVSGGYAKIKASGVGENSVIASIIRLVQDANADKAPIAKLADKISGIFVPVVIGIALVTFAAWLIAGQSAEFAMSLAISVLVISCPCALGLATPVAVMVGTGKGAENGILVKSGEALQTLHSVKTVIFDKTGTITYGKPEVTDVIPAMPDKESESLLLKTVGAIEQLSEHPLGKAIALKAAGIDGEFPIVTAFTTYSGRGVGASADGKDYLIGNLALMIENNVQTDDALIKRAESLAEEGKTPMLISCGGKLIGIVAVADTVKPTSAFAIAELKRAGVRTVMLTGDNKRTAAAVAKTVGVDEVYAEVLPADKEEVVKKFIKKGVTAMVGDGINDAPALTRADVGIAVGAGADIALDSADVILIKNDLNDVATAVRLSKATIRNVKENLFWAFFYNALCIPLAAGVLYPAFNIRLNPMFAAAAMSLSSLFVVGNALRLKFFKAKRLSAQKDGECTIGNNICRTSNDCVVVALEKKERATENNICREPENAEKENKTMNYRMFIEGMSCGHCKARVEKALTEAGVKGEVNLEGKYADFSAGESADITALEKAVTDAGYDVVRTEKRD